MDNPPEKQLNIYVSAELTQSLIEDAKKETQRLRTTVPDRKSLTRSGLAYEIFIWAYAIYKEVGSLKALKLMTVANFIHGTNLGTLAERNATGRAESIRSSTKVPGGPKLVAHSQESNLPVNMDERVNELLGEFEKHAPRPTKKKKQRSSNRD